MQAFGGVKSQSLKKHWQLWRKDIGSENARQPSALGLDGKHFGIFGLLGLKHFRIFGLFGSKHFGKFAKEKRILLVFNNLHQAHRRRQQAVLLHVVQGPDTQLRDRLSGLPRIQAAANRSEVLGLQRAQIAGRILREVLEHCGPTLCDIYQGLTARRTDLARAGLHDTVLIVRAERRKSRGRQSDDWRPQLIS